jgi:uncharacterized protein with NAD-binding domain and iron-sulfur cluster
MAKKRIAILGGGMSSLVTAFELTSRPGWQNDLDITVYQTGWRLGGKGASGRNREVHDRIEEHGLHIMFGFYDNVFRVMKQAYSELGRAPTQPLATWQEAFKPHDLIVMMEQVGEEFVPWAVSPPRNNVEPGTPGLLLGPFDYLLKLFEHAVERFHSWSPSAAPPAVATASKQMGYASDIGSLRGEVRAVVGGAASMAAGVAREGLGLVESLEKALWGAVTAKLPASVAAAAPALKGEFAYLDLAHGLARGGPGGAEGRLDPGDHESIGWLLRQFLDWLWKEVEDVSLDFRRLRLELDFACTLIIGMIEDDLILPPVDWFKIDSWDFRDWLRHHGANQATIASPITSGLYDAIFSTNAAMGAGTIVHLLLCMGFTYKTAVNFKMQAGMGDTVFTPLYLVLERRGVRFEFFHCVNEVKLSSGPGPRRVERIEIGVQATLKKEFREYDPLVTVKDLACWPSEPNYQYLAQGDILERDQVDLEDWWTTWKDVGQKTLVVDKDFDVCVLGISIGAFKYICKDMIEDQANPRFARMVDTIATCQTAAAQLWFGPDLQQTGWSKDLPDPIVIPYVEPLDTWCDMTQLVCRETWPTPSPVGSCHYLCSNLVDVEPLPPRDHHEYAIRQNQRVHDITVKWLEENVHWLWPKAAMPADKSELNWYWLVDEKSQAGVKRFDSQYWHAPTSPSERYNLSVPTSSWARLRSDESGYPNLVLTGDWTLTALSAGCLEAATMSGIMSANAVDGGKRPISNDWLPASGPVSPGHGDPSVTRALPDTLPTSTPYGTYGQPIVPAGTGRVSGGESRLKPPFIPRDGILMGIPPVYMTAEVYMFMLDADLNAIGRMCDQYLNLGGPTVYRPLVPFVMFYASNLNSTPVTDPIGWCPEKDFGFWVPVVGGRVEGPLFFPEKVQLFTPYLWVDTGVAQMAGREIFGFSKELGYNMILPADPSQPARFSCDTLVIPKYGRDATTVIDPIISVGKVGGGFWHVIEQLWNDGVTVMTAVEELLTARGPGHIPIPDGKLFLQLLRDFAKIMPMVFLKQFPDVEDPAKACYQAIVENNIRITSGIKGGFIPGEYGIDIWGYDSHQIVKNLGLKVTKQVGNKSELRSLLHGWTKFDGVVEKGKVTWEPK